MFTISNQLLSVLLALVLLACTQEPEDDGLRPRIVGLRGDSILYLGGEFQFRAQFDPAVKPSEVHWRTGYASIISQNSLLDEGGLVVEDTLLLEWNKMPPFRLDTVWIDSVAFSLDTLYVDTIAALNGEGESDPIEVYIENLTPLIDSVMIGPHAKKVEFRRFTLPGHRGATLRFQLSLTDPFQKNYQPRFKFSEGAGIQLASEMDSIYTFEWEAPDSLFQDTVLLELSDSRGGAPRVYEIHRFTYNESGSIWVGARKDLVKVSSLGQEIFRITDPFVEISQIAIHPNRPFVWVLDRGRNQILRFHYSGERLQQDSTSFTQPTAMTLDIQSDRLWIADLDSSKMGRMRRFDVTGFDSLGVDFSIEGLGGPVSSMDMDQFEADILWFTLPEADQIGKVESGVITYIDSLNAYERPHLISYDASASEVWVADSSKVFVLKDDGSLQATRSGFGFISGLDSGPQGACVSDGRLNEVVRFANGISGNQKNNDGRVKTGFDLPMGVAFEQISGDCWVADRESGRLFKIDRQGTILLTVDGFVQPTVIAVHQGVE